MEPMRWERWDKKASNSFKVQFGFHMSKNPELKGVFRDFNINGRSVGKSINMGLVIKCSVHIIVHPSTAPHIWLGLCLVLQSPTIYLEWK